MSDPLFEAFVNTELPRRSVHLDNAITGYDGDPNGGGAPAIIVNSPVGAWFRELTAAVWWRKTETAVWELQGAGGGPSATGSGLLIFQDGGVATGPVVFNDWDALYTQLLALRAASNGEGEYIIGVDDSLASGADGGCDVPASATIYDLAQCTFITYSEASVGVINFLDGTSVINLRNISGGVTFQNFNTTTPLEALVAGPAVSLNISDNAVVQTVSGSTAAVWDATAAPGLFIVLGLRGGARTTFFRTGRVLSGLNTGAFLLGQAFDVNPASPPFGSTNTIFGDASCVSLIQSENTSVYPELPNFLGSRLTPQLTEPAFTKANPWLDTASKVAVPAGFGEMVRLDASDGPISQPLPAINGASLPSPGVMTTVAEVGGGQVTITPSAGDSINGGIKGTNILTLAANPAATETVVVAGRTYTFVTPFVDAIDNVFIGATASDSIDNLIAAINDGVGGPGEGTLYGTGTALNADIKVVAGAGDTMDAATLKGGTLANAVTTTETLAAGGSQWAAATMLGGAAGSFLVSPNGGAVIQGDGINDWKVVSAFDPADAPAPAVVWQPGGTENGPVVFSDFQDVSDRIDAIRSIYGESKIRLVFDKLFTNPITLPVGTFDMTNVEWVVDFDFTTIRIPEGCILLKLRNFLGNMRVENRATATSPITDLIDGEAVTLRDGAVINQFGTVPMYDFVNLGAGDFCAFLMLELGGIGNYAANPAGGPLINLPVAGTQLNINSWLSGNVSGGQLGGIAGTVINGLSAGAGSRWDPSQPAFLGTLTQFSFFLPGYTLGAPVTGTTTLGAFNRVDRFDTTAGDLIGDLPSAASLFRGTVRNAKNYAGGNNVNVTPDGADTIDGVAAINAIGPGQSAQYVSDGVSDWTAIATGEPAGTGGDTPQVVFQPGGAPIGDTVFTDFDAMMAQIAAIKAGGSPAIKLFFDGSVVSPIVIPAAPPTAGTPDAAFTGPVGNDMTMTDGGANFTFSPDGRFVTIAGATTPANNGTFPVTAVTPTTIDYTNAAGVAEAQGAATYSITTPHDMTGVEWTDNSTSAAPLFAYLDVQIPEGVTFTGLRRIGGTLNVICQATTISPDQSLVNNDSIIVFDQANIQITGAVSLWDAVNVASGEFFLLQCFDAGKLGQLNTHTSPVANVPNAGAGVFGTSYGGQTLIRETSFGGVAGATLFLAPSGSGANIRPTHPAFAGTITQFTSDRVRYSIDTALDTGPTDNMNAAVAGRVARYDTTAGNIAANIPPASEIYRGESITIKNEVGLNIVNVNLDGADTIDGVAATFAVPPSESFTFISDGASNWTRVFSGSSPAANAAITLAAAVTTFAKTSKVMSVTGDGGTNTIGTITGAASGDELSIIFRDGLVTITDDGTATADTINLSAALTGAANTVLKLLYDGTSWYEVSRSVN